MSYCSVASAHAKSVSCIGESFGVDPDSDASQYSLAPASLLSLLDVYLKTKAKSSSASSSTPASAPKAEAGNKAEPTSTASLPGPSPQDKSKAEALKTTGNGQMSQKQYEAAIASYTSAIALSPNPVYYSNRAAAWSAQGDHGKAADDAQASIDLDPMFVKGYSRLGHARFSMGDWEGAVQAYEEGLEVDPANATMKASLATAKAKAKEEGGAVAESSSRAGGGAQDANPLAGLAGLMGGGGGGGGMPDLSALAGMMGGAGRGGGGGGGMPDLASLMNNPQMMAM
jgi:small glutamine-rich tetratricopeptide repeat-containing protein alpha